MKVFRGIITVVLTFLAIGILVITVAEPFFPNIACVENLLSNIDKVSAPLATVAALYTAIVANKISENSFMYSEEPHIQCYLTTYKTGDKTPFIVLVIENIGNVIARNVQVVVTYPEGIEQSVFAEEAKRINNIPFTLAPKTKLSTPITWSKNRESILNGNITISLNYEYQNVYGKRKKKSISNLN